MPKDSVLIFEQVFKRNQIESISILSRWSQCEPGSFGCQSGKSGIIRILRIYVWILQTGIHLYPKPTRLLSLTRPSFLLQTEQSRAELPPPAPRLPPATILSSRESIPNRVLHLHHTSPCRARALPGQNRPLQLRPPWLLDLCSPLIRSLRPSSAQISPQNGFVVSSCTFPAPFPSLFPCRAVRRWPPRRAQ